MSIIFSVAVIVTSRDTDVNYYNEYTSLKASVIMNNPIINPPYKIVIKNKTNAE